MPCSFVTPIDLRTPYSQMFYLTFYFVETSSRKKVIVSAIAATIPTRTVKTIFMLTKLSCISFLSSKNVFSSVNKLLKLFATNKRYLELIFGLSFINS